MTAASRGFICVVNCLRMRLKLTLYELNLFVRNRHYLYISNTFTLPTTTQSHQYSECGFRTWLDWNF